MRCFVTADCNLLYKFRGPAHLGSSNASLRNPAPFSALLSHSEVNDTFTASDGADIIEGESKSCFTPPAVSLRPSESRCLRAAYKYKDEEARISPLL
ncbi:hypothetical protein MHYP_G00267120 [Metynnis hypsauchen]